MSPFGVYPLLISIYNVGSKGTYSFCETALRGQGKSNAGGQVLLFDILYTRGNNRGMKVQSAVINKLSRIKI
jgi:hypothetical protein